MLLALARGESIRVIAAREKITVRRVRQIRQDARRRYDDLRTAG